MATQFWKDAGLVRALLPPEEPERQAPFTLSELAGFYDGDGSFYISEHQIGANITQCHYASIRMIQKRFGGTIYKRVPKKKKHRMQYSLSMRNIEVTSLIPIIADHLVLKADRANRVLKSLDHYNATDAESRHARLELEKFDQNQDPIRFSRINKDYIRGLFCAEGCLQIGQFSICQAGCVPLLHAIKEYVDTALGANLGKVTDKDWIITKQANIKLTLDWMTDNNTRRLFHEEKAVQIDIFYEYLDIRARRVTFDAKISVPKHINSDIPGSTLAVTNAVARAFTATLRSAAAGREIAPNKPLSESLSDAQRYLTRELLMDETLSLAAIAERVGCTKAQVSYLKKSENIERPGAKPMAVQMTSDQKRIARELLADISISFAVIAERVGCTTGQVWRLKESEGIAGVRPVGRKFKTGTELRVKKPAAVRNPQSARLTKDQKRLAQELLRGAERLTLDAIAGRVGCTKGQLWYLKKKTAST